MITATAGLWIITIAWLVQLISAQKRSRFLNPMFPAVYCIGVLLLVIDSYSSGSMTTLYLNITSLLASASVALMTLKK